MKEAVVDFYRERRALSITPEQVVVSSGAKQSLFQVCVEMQCPPRAFS